MNTLKKLKEQQVQENPTNQHNNQQVGLNKSPQLESLEIFGKQLNNDNFVIKRKSQFTSPILESKGEELTEILGLNLNMNNDNQVGPKISSRKQSNYLEIKDILNENCKNRKHFVVGLSGGICAGKKNLVNQFKKKLGSNICYLSLENFYKSEKLSNFDLPESINWDKMKQQLYDLLNDKAITIEVYDLIQEINIKTKLIEPTQVIILEGTFIFYDEELRNKMDLKIYLDTDQDLRVSRMVYRDVCIKKQDVKQCIDKYMKQVKPAFEKYVLPYKKYADIIIPNYGGEFNISTGDDKKFQEINKNLCGFKTVQHPVIDIISDKIQIEVQQDERDNEFEIKM